MSEKILYWCKRSKNILVIEAMKKAVEQGKRYWGYVEAILLNWERKGVYTMEEVAMLDEIFVAEKGKKQKQSPKKKKTRMEELNEMLDRLEANLEEQEKNELLG